MNKNKRNTQKGITLIALIITIIILLILAVVSIRLVMNNGIIGKAEKATTDYQTAEEQEQIKLGYSEYQMSKAQGESNPKLKVTEAAVTGTGPWTITFDKTTGNVYTLSEDGKTITLQGGTSGGTIAGAWTDNGDGTFQKGEIKVAIGDYVNYNEGKETYTTDTSKGVGGSVGTKDSKTGKYPLVSKTYKTSDDDLNWRVLGVNAKGELELISDNPTTNTVYLANEEGYLYGADELNIMCNTLYGKGTDSNGKVVATGARSLNVDDINKLGNYDPTTHTNYGTKWTYRFPTSGNYMQYKTTKADGTLVTDWKDITDSRFQTFRFPGESETISVDNKKTSEPLEYTSYSYTISDYVKQTTSDGKSMADIITKGTGTSDLYQWLVSRCVGCGSLRANFYVRLVYDGAVDTYESLYTSDDYVSDSTYYVRPVVSLSSDIQLSGSSESGWTIN